MNSIKRSESKLEGAGEYLKAKYREEARKGIGSLVMQEHGHPVSDFQGMCRLSSCFSCLRIGTCKGELLPLLPKMKGA